MSLSMEIAKAGWLQRQSTVLRRWKKNWFVLYQDGVLRFFETLDSSRAEEVFVIRSCCKTIKTGGNVGEDPPQGSNKSAMLQLDIRDYGNLTLAADSLDDMRAWQFSLEQARTMGEPQVAGGMVYQPGAGGGPLMAPHYPHSQCMRYRGGYPGQVITPPPGSQIIQNEDGTITILEPGGRVVYMGRPPQRYSDGYGGMGMGFLGGAMLGSALMWPWILY